jgi:hypothetical protein
VIPRRDYLYQIHLKICLVGLITMLMATFIHALEGITVLLLGAMSLQVFKCYARFTETGQFGNSDLAMHGDRKSTARQNSFDRSAQIRGADPLSKFNQAPSSSARRVNEIGTVANTHAQHVSQANSSTVDILDDYIGEFFAGAEPPATRRDIPTLEARVSDDMITERFIAQRNEVDEEVILVAEQSVDQTPQPAQVMSNKVVRAMLDEARTAISN